MNMNTATIEALPIPEKGHRITFFAGAVVQGTTAPKGFGVRVTAAGVRSYILSYTHRGREHRITIGQHPTWNAIRAVREARELRIRVDRGENPMEDRAPPSPAPEAPKTVADVVEEFLQRYASRLKSERWYAYSLRQLVVPAIGKTPIHDLKRSRIATMFDEIAERNGEVQCNRTIAYFRKALNWWAMRDDDFTPPLLKGMARRRVSRARVLNDDEIRSIWQATGNGTAFSDIVRTLLLTGQRLSEVSGMPWSELDSDIWTLPPERNMKTKLAHAIPLSAAALAIIEARPRDGEFVFSRGGSFQPWYGKRMLDKTVPIPRWTLHDLRRTAKTLMVRAGVRPDISERVLGHVVRGVEGVYDRHSYLDEKRDALERLAAAVERILNPEPGNVVPLRQMETGRGND
jgi:integrase